MCWEPAINQCASLQGSNFDNSACGKHQQSQQSSDDVEIMVMHPTLTSNRMIVGNMIAGGFRQGQKQITNRGKRKFKLLCCIFLKIFYPYMSRTSTWLILVKGKVWMKLWWTLMRSAREGLWKVL
ncbi:uncharacterized protein LOC111338442 [Stylophora pistillata]|uniref:uncharacterized protein LOC111338442 n=1 Tax=Stylophora pistillata TaxID=50429 RepID=UPI000C04F536|nr:uncharacterized protein LOC111338442 [Stylophora pistillata]